MSHEAFTRREREVAAELVAGANNREIAQRLFLAVDTVKSHVKAILRKTGTTNRAAAAAVLRPSDVIPSAGVEVLAPIRALIEGAPHRADCRYNIPGVGKRILIDLDELRRALAEAEAAA